MEIPRLVATDLGRFEVTAQRFLPQEYAPGWTPEKVNVRRFTFLDRWFGLDGISDGDESVRDGHATPQLGVTRSLIMMPLDKSLYD